MKADFIEALNAIEKERGISKDILIDAFESALVAAYKRNYNTNGNVLRFVPPLIVNEEEIDIVIKAVDEAMTKLGW